MHQQPSIAVLPFASMSRDADDEYLSDGLAEEILNVLAHIPGLKVEVRPDWAKIIERFTFGTAGW